MTIGRKLYWNFGAILLMVVVLFFVNIVAMYRERSAKAAAAQVATDSGGDGQNQISDDAEPIVS